MRVARHGNPRGHETAVHTKPAVKRPALARPTHAVAAASRAPASSSLGGASISKGVNGEGWMITWESKTTENDCLSLGFLAHILRFGG